MATLGDTSEPTSTAEAFDDAYISFGHVLTMPSGGPWLITHVGVWLAGFGETSTCVNVLWSGSTGAQLEVSASYEATQRGFSPSGSDLYNKSLLNGGYEISGGSSIIVGVRRTAGEAIFFGKRASGSFRKNEISSMVGNETINTGAMGAYITYVAANAAPTAPTLNDPTGGELVSSQTPTLNFTPHDPNGDTHTGYTYQVDNNSDFSSPVESVEVNGSFTDNVAINRVVSASLTRGTTYYWRVKTKDATNGYGPYSASASFKIAQLPSVTMVHPGSAQTAKLYYSAGSNTTPKIRAEWTYSCPDGHSQDRAIIRIYADSAGSVGSLLNTDTYNGSNAFYDTTYAVAEGTYYHVSVEVRCSLLLSSAESTKRRCRTRWGRATYYFDATSTPTTLSALVDSTVSADQQVVIEYATHSGGSAVEPSTWYSSVGAAGLNRWLWHRVTMFAWGSASPTSPKLNSLQWLYSGNALTLDFWTMASGASVDQGTYVYGSQSLKHATNGSTQDTYQIFSVTQNTNILGHIKIKTLGQPNAQLLLMDAAGTVTLASATATASTDWTRYITPVINTGSASQIRVVLRTNAAASNTAWFDIGKAEDGTVATPWNPRFLGALRMDAGGMIVDGVLGAIFRLRGSAGGSRDQVELGTQGWKFGGVTSPVNLWSPAANELRADGAIRVIRTATTDHAFAARDDGDSTDRVRITAGGTFSLGDGAGSVGAMFTRSSGGNLDLATALELETTSILTAASVAGALVYDDESFTGAIRVGDGVQDRLATGVGWAGKAMGLGIYDFSVANSSSFSLAAVSGGNGGAYKWPIIVPTAMEVEQLWLWTSDTATARTAEWRLYVDRLQDSTNGNSVMSGTFSFTPSAGTWRSSAPASPVKIAPGFYWLVIRNTSTTQTFGIGRGAATGTGGPARGVYLATAPALASPYDLGALNSGASNPVLCALEGRVLGDIVGG